MQETKTSVSKETLDWQIELAKRVVIVSTIASAIASVNAFYWLMDSTPSIQGGHVPFLNTIFPMGGFVVLVAVRMLAKFKYHELMFKRYGNPANL